MNKAEEALRQLHEDLGKLEPTVYVEEAEDTTQDLDEDDIELMAERIARKAVKGYEPVPYTVLKELGQSNDNMLDSTELVYDIIDSDDFATKEIFQKVYDSACDLVEEWNESNGGFWWKETEPEPEDYPPV